MTYRGIVSNGVIIIDGERLIEGTIVDVIPRTTPFSLIASPAVDPANGLWKDRTDLPRDSIQASKVLRAKLMRRENE